MRRTVFLSLSLDDFICKLGPVTLFWLLALVGSRSRKSSKGCERFFGLYRPCEGSFSLSHLLSRWRLITKCGDYESD